MGAITPGAFSLDGPPLDSPLYCLDGVGDPAVISGYGILVALQAYGLAAGLVAHAESFGASLSGGTTGINTIGANLLVLSLVGGTNGLAVSTVSDNMGNIWTQIGTIQGSTATTSSVIYYVNSQTPRVGVDHTVSWSSSIGVSGVVQFMAFNSSIPWSLDSVQQGVVPFTAGSGPVLVPAVAGELIISAAVGSPTGNMTGVGDGLTIMYNRAYAGGVSYAGAWAYKVQPSASSVQATWTGTPGTQSAGVHLVAFIGGWAPGVQVLYFGGEGYNDPTGPGYFSPRMVQSLNFRRDLFSGNTTGGANRVSYGELRLANDDGGLDMLRTQYAFAGWPATLYIGDPSQPWNTFEVLITGKPQQAFFSFRDLAITLRDRLQDFAQDIQTHKYAGDNILPNGFEGVTDLKDKPKPLLFGHVTNISPILVNTAKLVYQVNDGPIEYLPMVYDQGVELTRGVDYISTTDMMTTQPAPGFFRCCMTDGYFRLGATPVGTITCDAADRFINTDLEIDVDNTAARVALRIASRPPASGEGGITDADVNWEDVYLLDHANSSAVGIWVDGGGTFSSALDQILGSIGAWYGFDRFGKFRMRRHEVPTGGGICTFKMFGPNVDAGWGDYDIIDVRFLPTNDPDRGVPSYEVTINYGLNYTVQSKDNLGGAVSEERRQFLGLQYRTVKASNPALKNAYPLAISKEFNSLLLETEAAQAEANRLLSLYGAQRDFVEIDTPLLSDLVATIDIGAEVFVVMPRFNYNTGKSMKIIGMQYNPGTRGLTLSLWG